MEEHSQQMQNIFITFCTTSAQRLRRWTDIVQMLYKLIMFTGLGRTGFSASIVHACGNSNDGGR